MNLYGEIGNIKALTYHLKEQGIKYEVKNISIDEDINFDELDLIYIGSGSEETFLILIAFFLEFNNDNSFARILDKVSSSLFKVSLPVCHSLSEGGEGRAGKAPA